MMDKKKKIKGVWILAGVLILLLAVYFGMRAWNQNREEKEEQQAEADTVHVTETAAADIVSLKFDVGSGEMEFTKENDTWYYAPDRDFPLVQSYPEDMAAAAGNIIADRELTDGDALEDYGLDEASRITVEATYTKDDEENLLRLYIGGEDGNGNRYVMVNDSRIVYLISTEICDNILNN